MKIRRNITKIASVILCAALLTVAMATSAFAAAPTESGMIDIAVSDSDAAFVANHLDALETVRDGALKLKSNIDISDYRLTESELSSLFAALRAVYPELFFVDLQYRYSYKTTTLRRCCSLMTSAPFQSSTPCSISSTQRLTDIFLSSTTR